jgi:hypothetical protein
MNNLICIYCGTGEHTIIVSAGQQIQECEMRPKVPEVFNTGNRPGDVSE